jgi:hypothetical protein
MSYNGEFMGGVAMLIATRELTLLDGGNDIKIPIRIFAPEFESPGAWSCRYEVDWPGENHVMTVWGFDGVQALLHALQIIGAEIYSSNYHEAGQLFFDKPGSGYGFPVMSNIRDLLQGNDKKYL